MMTDEATTGDKSSNDEKSSGSGKLESMSREDLIKIVKNQISLKKRLENKITELLTSNSTFYRNEEQLRKELTDDRSKHTKLLAEFDQNKIQLSKVRDELSLTHQSLESFKLENERLTASQQKLQDELSKLQNEISSFRSSSGHESQSSSSDSALVMKFISTTIDLLQLPISSSGTIDDQYFMKFKNGLEQKQDNVKQVFEQAEQDKIHLQQRIEDLEFLNEEVKLEIDDLRIKSSNYQKDKQFMEKEIDNYRRQVEDFEEQFLELQRESCADHRALEKKPSLTSCTTAVQQSEDNNRSQSKKLALNKTDDHHSRISKSSSTSSLLLSSDIPTLLHSIGITNCADEDFSVPLNFESVLRLCTLLIERCRVLQYILLKNDDLSTISSVDNDHFKDCVLFLQSNNCEQCKIFVHRQDHTALDTLFERIYCGMNETTTSNDWHIIIEKPIDQKTLPYVRLEFNDFKFVPEEVEQNLVHLRSQYETLSRENDDQRKKISELENRLHSNKAYEQLKQQQSQLEKQLSEQCAKTVQLESIIKQENIDQIKIDQLQQIEVCYSELQAKYRVAKKLEEQLKQLNQTMSEKDLELKQQSDLFDRLKADYDNQQARLLERDESIRKLTSQLKQNDEFKENLIEKYQNQIKTIHKELEHQKSLFLNAANDQDEHYSLIVKYQNELNGTIQTKTDENQRLNEENARLSNESKENHQVIVEKNKQIEEFQKAFNLLNTELHILKDKVQTIKEEKNQLASEVNVLLDKITFLEKEKLDFMKNIVDLKEKLEENQTNLNQNKSQLQQADKSFQRDFELNKSCTQDVRIKQTIVSENTQVEVETVQKESEVHPQNVNNKHENLQQPKCDSDENIQELKEKYHKMKVLLTRLKKELQDKSQHQPKQSLIDLELADYEKTIKTLRDDLGNKDKEIQELQDELSSSSDRYRCLKLENNNLEQQIIQLEERANKFKGLLDIAKKELQNAKELELQRHYNDDHVRVLLEKFQKDIDDNKVLICELQSERQQLIEKLKSNQEANQKTTTLLEQNLRIAKHELDIFKKDYETLHDDFNSYKIRAQSVLKQHQLSQHERTSSVAEKQTELEETIEKLNRSLQETNDKIQLLLSDNDTLQKERSHLMETQAQLINDSRKREQDLRKHHKIDLDKIEKEYLHRMDENQNALAIIQLQNETLSTAFREQITALELEQERAISMLQNELDLSRQEIVELKQHISLLEQTNNSYEILTSNPQPSNFGINNNNCNVDDTLACRISERQQSEELDLGNVEYQTSNAVNKTTDNIQNDNSSNDIDNPNPNTSPLNNSSSTSSSTTIETERQYFNEELRKTKDRLLEITELFNESELNNKRLNEQVTLLKDEIRRIERNIDRAESISNLEYLKNVIVKFFVLKSTPERLQLIPVLVTMLKLSPDEQAQLVRAADISNLHDENSRSNESPTQIVNDPSALSWGSYLHMW